MKNNFINPCKFKENKFYRFFLSIFSSVIMGASNFNISLNFANVFLDSINIEKYCSIVSYNCKFRQQVRTNLLSFEAHVKDNCGSLIMMLIPFVVLLVLSLVVNGVQFYKYYKAKV